MALFVVARDTLAPFPKRLRCRSFACAQHHLRLPHTHRSCPSPRLLMMASRDVDWCWPGSCATTAACPPRFRKICGDFCSISCLGWRCCEWWGPYDLLQTVDQQSYALLRCRHGPIRYSTYSLARITSSTIGCRCPSSRALCARPIWFCSTAAATPV